MLNPEHFGHFFDVTCSLNLAAAVFITLSYKYVYYPLTEAFKKYASGINEVRLSLEESFVYKKGSGKFKYFANGFKWLAADSVLWLLTPFVNFTSDKMKNIKTEREFVLKYFPLFAVSGIFGIAMLLFSGILAECSNKASIHQCQADMLVTVFASYLYILCMMAVLEKFKSLRKIILCNLLIFVFISIVCIVLIKNIEIGWLHLFIHDYTFLISFLIIVFSALPLIYFIIKLGAFLLSLGSVKTAHYIADNKGNKNMKKLLGEN